jgi:hypothetical protein
MSIRNIATTAVAALMVSVAAFPAQSGDHPPRPSAAETAHLPASSFHAERRTGNATTTVLMTMMVKWLAENFDLPLTKELPRIAVVSAERMAAARYAAFVSARTRGAAARNDADHFEHGDEVEAFYDDATRTIYLPRGWRADSAAELSILVHELVHHLQKVAGLRYPCALAREALAFAAQEQWLSRFGGSLESDFGMDRMTVFLRTRCIY